MKTIDSIAELETHYGSANETSTIKEVDRLIPEYCAYIAVSPFAVLATSGPEGLDASPRGDLPGFVRIHDDKTLLMPDRRGNNRIDSLRNIVRDPRVALLFLLPGLGNTLRVNGRAKVTADPAVLQSFVVDGKAPRSVIVITVDAVYFQCARAIVRSELWNPQKFIDRAAVPTPGSILARLSNARIGGDHYDSAWNARAKETLW